MNSISDLTKEAPESSPASFHHVSIREVCHPEEGHHLTMLLCDLRFPASRTVRNVSVVYKPEGSMAGAIQGYEKRT